MAERILIPFELPDPEPLSPILVAALSSLDIVVLGIFDLPEQTPPGAAREQFETTAQATLDDLAEPFVKARASVKTRLVFGKDRGAVIDQVAIEEDCSAEFDPAPTTGIERILAPISDVPLSGPLPSFVDLLCEDSTPEITLFHVIKEATGKRRANRLFEKPTIK